MRRLSCAVLLACMGSCSPATSPDVDPGHEGGPGAGNGRDGHGDGGANTQEGDDGGDTQTGDDADDGAANGGDASDSDNSGGDGDDQPPGNGTIAPLACDEAFEVEGLHGCLSTVDGTQVKFFPVPDGHEVQNLAVYLHQDTAWEWYSNEAFPVIVEWALSRDIMVMAPLAPASDEGDPEYGAVGTVGAVNQLGGVIETFRDAYDASRERIYYWGGSGGSWFMAFWFIPQLGKRLPGIFVPSCGGDISNPYDAWAWDPALDSETRSRIAIYFNYGSEDFLAPNIEAGIDDYLGKGFVVDSLVHPRQQHCQHDIDGPTLDFWSRHL